MSLVSPQSSGATRSSEPTMELGNPRIGSDYPPPLSSEPSKDIKPAAVKVIFNFQGFYFIFSC